MSRSPSPRKPKMTEANKPPSIDPAKTEPTTVGTATSEPSKWSALDKTKDWAFDMPEDRIAKGVMVPQHETPKEVDPVLVEMLCWPRSHGTPEEQAFTQWLKTYFKDKGHKLVDHAEGAFSIDVPAIKAGVLNNDSKGQWATTLFSCHVDTVDRPSKDAAARKKLVYDPGFGLISLDSQNTVGNCLGADDSAGIWMMMQMLAAGVPGTYLFHRGEECGGVSAKAIAQKESAFVKRFQVAVAFDRKSTGDIVTHQGGLVCASNKFASRLGDMLAEHGMNYKASTTGSYTDVKEYRKIIPEVVNLSVGYENAHGPKEELDYGHLVALAKACCGVAWESLPIDRDPSVADPTPPKQSTFGWTKPYQPVGKGKARDISDEERQWGARDRNGAKNPLAFDDEGFDELSFEEIADWCGDDPHGASLAVVRLLREKAKLAADNAILTKLLGL